MGQLNLEETDYVPYSEDDLQWIAQWAAEESDAIKLFRPMPPEFMSQEDVLRAECLHKLIRGGNRSGKSTIAAVMFAAAARDMPITTWSGEEIHVRRPWQRGKPLLMWVVGYDWDHIGDTIYRLLCEPNHSLKMIRDLETGVLRAFKPWDPSDAAREDETEPCPPLIPGHEIERIVWKNAGAHIFDQIRLRNGTVIHGHSSKEAKAGDPVDIIWVDEKVEYEINVAEWQARLGDKRGQFWWSTWPTSTNTALRSMSRKAKSDDVEIREGKRKRRTVQEWVFKMYKNPYMPAESKQDLLENWQALGAGHVQARNEGEFVDEGDRAYPMFNEDTCAAIVHGDLEDVISRILRKRNGEPPSDWARFMMLDPGTTRPALLFGAIPPPALGDWRVIYQEIIAPGHDAFRLMKLAEPFFQNYSFQTFVIDMQAGRKTGEGHRISNAENYSNAMRKYGIRSEKTGFGFVPGSPDINARRGIIQSWMHVGASGLAKLRIVKERCKILVHELSTVKTKVTQAGAEKIDGREHDATDTLEYFGSIDPQWEPPVHVERQVLKNPAEVLREYLETLRPSERPKSSGSVFGACGNGR